MTDTQSMILFILVSLGIVACIGDYITTQKGFDAGLTEGNPVARWLQKKIGMAQATFVSTAAFIFTSGLLAMLSAKVGIAFAASILGIETFNTVRNYRMLPKK